MKIYIRKSPTADTRTCDFANVSQVTLLASSHQQYLRMSNPQWTSSAWRYVKLRRPP